MDPISSGLQKSDISIRILSEIKMRTGTVPPKKSFPALPVPVLMSGFLFPVCEFSIPLWTKECHSLHTTLFTRFSTGLAFLNAGRPELCFFFFIHNDIKYLLSFKEIVLE